MISLEKSIFSYFESMKQYMRAQPLNLGGIPGSGGGAGGPPGGFVGYLPQTRVAYDYSEVALSGPSVPPPSGIRISLLDNLNHIRFRIANLEAGSGGGGGQIGISVSGVVLASDVRVLNLQGDFKIDMDGTTANIDYGTYLNDDLTSQINGARTLFSLEKTPTLKTLNLFYNGIRQYTDHYTAISGGVSIQTGFTPLVSDNLVAEYKYYLADQPAPTTGGWGSSSWGSTAWGA